MRKSKNTNKTIEGKNISITGDGELLSYYCDFDKVKRIKSSKLTEKEILVRELPEFGHYEVIEVLKMNILA